MDVATAAWLNRRYDLSELLRISNRPISDDGRRYSTGCTLVTILEDQIAQLAFRVGVHDLARIQLAVFGEPHI